MKHTFSLLSLAALLILSSCGKTETVTTPSPEREDEKIAIVFSLNGECAATAKASSEEVTSLDILIFRASTGQIDSYSRVLGSHASVVVPKGRELEYRLVANIAEGKLSGVKTLTEFEGTLTDLRDEEPSHPLMIGRGRGTFLSESTTIVEMTRLISRVILQKITPTYYEPGTFTLRQVYLINAVGQVSFLLDGAVAHWYNRTSYEASNTVSVLSTGNLAISNQMSSLDINTTLYTYPNSINEDVFSSQEPSFTPRKTRLVIEASHLGETEYFPITLPSVNPNTTYLIKELIITGPGTSHPDTQISREAVNLTIEIKPWGYNDINAPLS